MTKQLPNVAPEHRLTTDDQLDAIYGEPVGGAVTKEIDHINAPYRLFVEKAPFVIVASCGPEGLDCTPRGDPAGFVRVVDEHTVLLPDRRGNNRIDTFRNLVRDPRISLLFLIPGVGETLRINGTAEIVTDPDLLASFEMQGKLPRSVIVTHVDRVYFQCPKALIRSRLWDPETQVTRSELPTSGQIQRAIQGAKFDAEEYDRAYPQRIKETIY